MMHKIQISCMILKFYPYIFVLEKLMYLTKGYSPKKGTTSLAASKNDFVSILLSSGTGKNR